MEEAPIGLDESDRKFSRLNFYTCLGNCTGKVNCASPQELLVSSFLRGASEASEEN